MAWVAAVKIKLSEAERMELEARSRRRKISRADAMRSEIILCAADGLTNIAIAERLGVSRLTVTAWRNVLPRTVWRALPTNPARGHRAKLTMTRSQKW